MKWDGYLLLLDITFWSYAYSTEYPEWAVIELLGNFLRLWKMLKGIWRLWCLIQNLDKGSHAWETMTSVSLQLIQARMLYYHNIYISSKKDHKPDSYCWRANHALLSSSLICTRPIRPLLLDGHHLGTCHPDTCHRPLRSLALSV